MKFKSVFLFTILLNILTLEVFCGVNVRDQVEPSGPKRVSNGKPPYVVNISGTIVHPKYSAPMNYYDIALMELQKDVDFSKFQRPACLWNETDTSPLRPQATFTGWGVIDAGSCETSPELQAAVVDVIDSETCNKLLLPYCNRHWCGLQENQLCAGKLAGDVDACQGDSGSPLQVKTNLPNITEVSIHYVIGVTSFGIGCAIENLPGIFFLIYYLKINLQLAQSIDTD